MFFNAQHHATFTAKDNQATSGANKSSSRMDSTAGATTKGIAKLKSSLSPQAKSSPCVDVTLGK